ncbi:hypothetical protein K438DRAFT_1960015 [Mycena galopus ATCC 62051]|nr:hypothetical protein K438DRAFT_1960015 [Mycena galopus ATCC 62051]
MPAPIFAALGAGVTPCARRPTAHESDTTSGLVPVAHAYPPSARPCHPHHRPCLPRAAHNTRGVLVTSPAPACQVAGPPPSTPRSYPRIAALKAIRDLPFVARDGITHVTRNGSLAAPKLLFNVDIWQQLESWWGWWKRKELGRSLADIVGRVGE